MDARRAQALSQTLDQLRSEVAQLQASRARITLAADADRRQIERELHEGVQQHLVALAVNLQLAGQLAGSDAPAAGELIGQMARDVQQALDEIARLARRIYPPLLRSRGLGAALRSAAADAQVSGRIEVTSEVGLAAPEVAAAVYFGVLDVLEQVRKDASVTVSVRKENGELAIAILDDDQRSGLAEAAFDTLRDGLEAFGGQLTVVSDPGLGTRVSGSLPLRR